MLYQLLVSALSKGEIPVVNVDLLLELPASTFLGGKERSTYFDDIDLFAYLRVNRALLIHNWNTFGEDLARLGWGLQLRSLDNVKFEKARGQELFFSVSGASGRTVVVGFAEVMEDPIRGYIE